MKWILIVLLWTLPARAAAGTLPSMVTVGTDNMRPWVDQKAPDFGIITRIVTRAFKLAHLQTHYTWMPWKRLFHPLHSTTLDAVFPMGFNEERARIFLYSDELVHLDRVACHLGSEPFSWSKPEDFTGKTIAFRRGSYFGSLYDYLREHNLASFVESDSDLSMLKMLLAQRVDLVFCQPREMRLSMQNYVKAGLMRPEEMSRVSTKGRPILSAPLHVGSPRRTNLGQDSRVSIQLRDRFNRGLAQLKEIEPELFQFHQD